jgi:predicted Holliday junction resolvase-like endonuclease
MAPYLTKEGAYVLLVVVVLFLLLFGKRIVWYLFSFDKRVEKLLFQKKSSEVRVGRVLESIAPLLSDFPVEIEKPGTTTQFLGQPIDFIHFDPEEGITFIEVKSGNAKLTESQKKLKKHIEEGRVFWHTYRVRGEEP